MLVVRDFVKRAIKNSLTKFQIKKNLLLSLLHYNISVSPKSEQR